MEEWLSVAQAAKLGRVKRQAIFNAIKDGQIPSEIRYHKFEKQYKGRPIVYIKRKIICVKKSDLESYRKSKYICEKRVFEGKKLFDIENDRWSVLHASKTFAQEFGYFYSPSRLYYLIRIGDLPAKKCGGAWVISKSDLTALYEREGRRQIEKEG